MVDISYDLRCYARRPPGPRRTQHLARAPSDLSSPRYAASKIQRFAGDTSLRMYKAAPTLLVTSYKHHRIQNAMNTHRSAPVDNHTRASSRPHCRRPARRRNRNQLCLHVPLSGTYLPFFDFLSDAPGSYLSFHILFWSRLVRSVVL